MATRTSPAPKATSPTSASTTAANLGGRAVLGLEGGRELARLQQRRRRVADRVKSGIIGLIAIAVIAVGGWVGYTLYEEQQRADAEEREQREAELDPNGDDLREAIDELEESPKWNGPGNANFGVGDEP